MKTYKLDTKSRHFIFVVYPEDLDDGWKDRLRHLNMPMALSPVHNKDKWTQYDIDKKKKYCEENNIHLDDPKKVHQHVLITYSNTTTLKNIYSIIDIIDIGVNYIEPCFNPKGEYDYFTHKYYPEKAQYDEDAIETYNGFCISDIYEIQGKELFNIKLWLVDYIKQHEIKSFEYLICDLRDKGMMDECYVCMNNTTFIRSFIDSNRVSHRLDIDDDLFITQKIEQLLLEHNMQFKKII